VPAGGRAFDDEAVDLPIRFFQDGGGEDVGGDDREKAWPWERRQLPLEEIGGIERHRGVVAFLCAGDVQRIAGRLVERETIEHAGNLQGNPGAHQHVADTGEHRAEERG
jgi:hypothetical protein